MKHKKKHKNKNKNKKREASRDIVQLSPMLAMCFLGVYGFLLFAKIREAGLRHIDMLQLQKKLISFELTELEIKFEYLNMDNYIYNEQKMQHILYNVCNHFQQLIVKYQAGQNHNY